MVIDRNGHDLLGIFLAYDVLVKKGLDLVGKGNVFDVDHGLFLPVTLVLLLDCRCPEHHVLKIGHVEKAYVGKAEASGKSYRSPLLPVLVIFMAPAAFSFL